MMGLAENRLSNSLSNMVGSLVSYNTPMVIRGDDRKEAQHIHSAVHIGHGIEAGLSAVTHKLVTARSAAKILKICHSIHHQPWASMWAWFYCQTRTPCPHTHQNF